MKIGGNYKLGLAMKKAIETWLVVNVKTGNCRCVKKMSAQRTLKNASDVAIQIKLDIEVPEQPILKAEGKITLSKTQISNMMIEQLTDASEAIK
jgi:hypothetical protein